MLGSSLNTLRAILVATAAVAVIFAAIYGMWTVVIVLGIGIVAHSALWLYLYRRSDDTSTPPPSSARPGSLT